MTRLRALIVMTVFGLRSPHGSARVTYQWRNPSNHSVKASTGFHGRHREKRAQRPANVGVIVNETASEAKVATATDLKRDDSGEGGPESSVDPSIIGTPADYQLARAVDMLRGIALFNGRVVN